MRWSCRGPTGRPAPRPDRPASRCPRRAASTPARARPRSPRASPAARGPRACARARSGSGVTVVDRFGRGIRRRSPPTPPARPPRRPRRARSDRSRCTSRRRRRGEFGPHRKFTGNVLRARERSQRTGACQRFSGRTTLSGQHDGSLAESAPGPGGAVHRWDSSRGTRNRRAAPTFRPSWDGVCHHHLHRIDRAIAATAQRGIRRDHPRVGRALGRRRARARGDDPGLSARPTSACCGATRPSCSAAP